jgi:hypothetical protein
MSYFLDMKEQNQKDARDLPAIQTLDLTRFSQN